MNAESNTQMMTGRINEKGFLNMIKAMGFNMNRCIGELLGNSKDAKAEIRVLMTELRLIFKSIEYDDF